MNNNKRKMKVLFIEDEVNIAFLYARAFEQDNFVIINAYTGEEGLIMAKNEKPDFILLDIMLPGMNGLDVLKELKASPSTMAIPVILLTNLSDDTTIKEGFARDAAGYIIKSFHSTKQIIEEVKSILKIS
jgi:DNA-binding response OmpR family regulator